jgi:hypothetical protein
VELTREKGILATRLEIATQTTMENAGRAFIKAQTDNSITHVMEVASKVEAKLFCEEEHKQNIDLLNLQDMETAVSLARGYERRLTAIVEASKASTSTPVHLPPS